MLILFKKCPCLCSPLHTRHSLCHPRGLPNKPLCPNCSFLNPFFVTRPIIARFILNLNQLHKFLTFLSEVLRLVDGKVPLLIEVKLPSADTEVCRRLDEELQGYRGKYMVQSFNSLVLRWMKKHRNEIPRGQLSENLTRKPDTTHYALRFCVKYLLSNCMCRPDFISYKWADRKNPGFLVNKKLFHAPVAAWTLHGEKDLRAAKRSFDMYIFELNDVGGKNPRL